MKNTEIERSTIVLETSGLEFRFPRFGDRYGLTVGIRSQVILETRIGSEADAWPAAPPLQQLHAQELSTGGAVLGVGSAGTTHWSASFSERAPGLVWCEYAARVSRPWNPEGEWLGTTFRVAEGWQSEQTERGLHLLAAGQRLELELLGSGSEVESIRSGEFAIRPIQKLPQQAKTVEWRVAVKLA